MTHREYTLTVENPIYETLGDIKATHKHVGQTVTLNREDFEKIKSGLTISRYEVAGHGMYADVSFNKDNFANEVTYTEVTIETGIAKLGKRKSK
jgi:hypothetical protein